MPGLMRAVARTAVVAGTATATSNAVNRRQASKNVAAYDDAQAQYEQQAPAPRTMLRLRPRPWTRPTRSRCS